ncbi:Plasmodium exported protein, unknown function [Plasmodium sp. gorilla clade G2]|uniref:Plasmodium exported protein, unknown function n=1 Tax=Plasmodium sp. gorilla clade G2 TaxID=880535 RepID=UPI000D2BA390|nr:Plasmodium exported protein, unknown function [Plasmodium sp. gorilla clade G2]SOV20302.1 Plasmodium exported protein, unknown function [Plasmodium sp. gorilla clade G2]
MNRALTRNSLTKETRLNDKLSKRNNEIDTDKNGHNMYENLQDQKERNYGVNKTLKNEYEKYNLKNTSSKSIHCMTRLKNWLYRKIFKESNFWIYMSTFTGVFGGAAGVSMFSTICVAGATTVAGATAKLATSLLPAFGGLWGCLCVSYNIINFRNMDACYMVMATQRSI